MISLAIMFASFMLADEQGVNVTADQMFHLNAEAMIHWESNAANAGGWFRTRL
tara:strand:+ start:12964 stop:13122 length:159 start_codon:yes stop_codon:yes gene_type:complete